MMIETVHIQPEPRQEKKPVHIPLNLNIEIATLLSNAKTLIKFKEYSMALNLLRQASNQDSKNLIILKTHADILRIMKKASEEIRFREEIQKIEYTFENVFYSGECLYRLERDADAQNKFFEALSILSEDSMHLFDLYRQLGNILVKQGDFDGAEEYYNKAYIRNPHSDILLVNLGTLEIQKNDMDKALFCFRKAINENRNNDKAWIGLSMVHKTFGDLELAWANVKEAVEINPRNKTALLLIANWAETSPQREFAISVLQEYLHAEDYDTDMALVLINFFCISKNFSAAKLEIERFLLWHPENKDVCDLKLKLREIKI